MNADERQVLAAALDSLSNIQVDTHVYSHQKQYGENAYDYDVLGRQILSKRLLAEFIGVPNEHMLPGEFYEDESDLEGLLLYTPAKRSGDGEPLTHAEKKWLQEKLLPMMYFLSGLSDSDDAVLRCARRRVAEAAGSNLSSYRLLYENEVKPLYLKSYQPIVE